ncbi:hypothetical protein ACJ41O_012409 [Fusarium nematophilum]
MSPPQGPARIAMRSKHYNEHCEIQHAAMRAGLHLIPSYSDSTIEPLKKVISTLPGGATASLIFEDTPFNDFGTLGKTIAQHFSSSQSPNGVFIAPSMMPLGFYQQVVPDGHADLGLSWSSLNYLQHIPNVSLDATAPPAEFAAARHKAFAAAAHGDLIKLLALRAKEIRQGGFLIAAVGGQNKEKPSSPGFQPLQAAMMSMVRFGKLALPELMQMAMFPGHERTVDEMRAALEDPEVSSLWEVEVLEAQLIEHPAWSIYQAADESNRSEAFRTYAQDILVNLVSASGWFWMDVLQKSRGDEWRDGDAFLDELTQMAVDECVANHADLKVEIWYNYVKLKRTDKPA